MKLEDKVVRREDLIATDLDGDLVMMDIMTGKYYKLSGVSGDIWEIIEQEVTVADLIAELMRRYDVAQETCTEQTTAFLQQLIDKGLVLVK